MRVNFATRKPEEMICIWPDNGFLHGMVLMVGGDTSSITVFSQESDQRNIEGARDCVPSTQRNY
jgi:hypothetical protein